MMKKILMVVVVLNLLEFSAIADVLPPLLPSQNSSDKTTDVKTEQQTNQIRIKIGVSASENYLYLPLASTICIFLNDTDGKACRVTQYKTSIDAIQGMLDGDVDIVLTNSASGKFAVDQNGQFQNNMQTKKIRSIGSIFDEKLAFLTRKDLNIKQLSALNGLAMNISKQDSVNRIVLADIIKEMQLKLSDFKTVNEFTNDEAIKAICKGTVDAVLIIAEEMNKDLKEATRVCELNIISFSQDEIKNMLQNSSYTASKIYGGTYIGIPHNIDTVAIRAMLLSTSDVTNDKILLLVSEISRHLNEIRLLHYSLNNLSMHDMFSLTTITPLHDGVSEFMSKNNFKK